MSGSVDVKIPPNGSSRFTYARAREIYFAPSYRTQSARACDALGMPVNLTCNWKGG